MNMHPVIAEELVRRRQEELGRVAALAPAQRPRRRLAAILARVFADSRDGRDWQARADWQPLEEIRRAKAAAPARRDCR